MFAMDGPTDNTSAPPGVLDCIHTPTSRPPGTPPVPARNEVEFAVSMLVQHVTTSQPATSVIAPALMARPARALPRASLAASSLSVSRPLARTANGATMGSRYWNPFTGQSWKKKTGTTIQHTSSDSRHDQLRASTVASSRPAAHTITGMPMAGGTTVG